MELPANDNGGDRSGASGFDPVTLAVILAAIGAGAAGLPWDWSLANLTLIAIALSALRGRARLAGRNSGEFWKIIGLSATLYLVIASASFALGRVVGTMAAST